MQLLHNDTVQCDRVYCMPLATWLVQCDALQQQRLSVAMTLTSCVNHCDVMCQSLIGRCGVSSPVIRADDISRYSRLVAVFEFISMLSFMWLQFSIDVSAVNVNKMALLAVCLCLSAVALPSGKCVHNSTCVSWARTPLIRRSHF